MDIFIEICGDIIMMDDDKIDLNDYREFINIPYVVQMKQLRDTNKGTDKIKEENPSTITSETIIGNYKDNFPPINFFDLLRTDEESKRMKELIELSKKSFIENYGKIIPPDEYKKKLDDIKKTFDEIKPKKIIFEMPPGPFKLPDDYKKRASENISKMNTILLKMTEN
jgi:hypothetical protein